MGGLAIDLARYYQIGSARGEYSLLSSMGLEKAEFFAVFGSTINNLILRHRVDLERKRFRRAAGPTLSDDLFVSRYYARTRWVDGTPEYSFHICGLRKLFPQALFIHIFRDATSVVRSMLHFHQLSGQSLVANVQEAYSYWLRTVSNCLLAERAYGPKVVFRVRHADLVDAPEATLRSIFSFLGEPFASECLQPLAQRVNSSNVPADFQIDEHGTDPSLVKQAMRLCREVEESSQPLEASAAAVEEIETAFDEQARDVSQLKEEGKAKDLLVLRLQKEFDERTAWALALKEEVKAKDLVILGLKKKLRRRRVDILKRILTGKSRR
jgi:hypothetical protein